MLNDGQHHAHHIDSTWMLCPETFTRVTGTHDMDLLLHRAKHCVSANITSSAAHTSDHLQVSASAPVQRCKQPPSPPPPRAAATASSCPATPDHICAPADAAQYTAVHSRSL
jgi:hypothetical protein